MDGSWGHAVASLPAGDRAARAALNKSGRWGGDCQYRGACAEPRTHVIRYAHRDGHGGTVNASREACAGCAKEFAGRHGLPFGPA